MSLFGELRRNPPKIEIKKGAKEVIFTTISAMCDNRHLLQLKKNSDGEFKLDGKGNSLRNWNLKVDVFEIEWAAWIWSIRW